MIAVETIGMIALLAILSILVVVNRRKISFSRFFIFYAAMYRTKRGLATMDRLANKYRWLWTKLATPIIIIGFLGMGLVVFDLIRGAIMLLTSTAPPSVGVVLPFKAKGIFYVPFFYWIISIFAILIIHEGMHGVMARVYNLRVKNSGLVVIGAIIPLIPGAFVEPDERKLALAPKKQQLAVYAAGPVSNIVTGALLMLLLTVAVAPWTDTFYAKDGVVITELAEGAPAQLAGLVPGDKIIGLNGQVVNTAEEFSTQLKDAKPGDTAIIRTTVESKTVILEATPDNGKARLGVYVDNPLKYNTWWAKTVLWIEDLLVWLALLSLGVGLFNLVPLGPIDGGRMLLTGLQHVTHHKNAHMIWRSVSLFLFAILITQVFMAFV